jgi:SET domain-containing protein
MLVPVEVRPSKIFGRGLFALQPIPRGSFLCSFSMDARLITEDEFLRAVSEDRQPIVRTGTRYIGRYFTYTDTPEAQLNFFNHAFEPNCLVCCGVVIALRDIGTDEELTIDYRTLTDATDVGVYNDAGSGAPIKGFTAKRTLLQTAKKLVELAESLDEDWQG